MNTLPCEFLPDDDTNKFYYNHHRVISVLKKELVILFLVGCLILASVPTALCRSPAPTIYVVGDGSGDFKCDGKDDHVEINQALKFVAENPGYTTVHLKGPFTYVIDDTLLIGSNTILEGDSSAVIELANHAGWPTMKPLIQQMRSSGNDNITVRGFEVNGNYAGNSEIVLGKGYYNIMFFTYCNNVKVYNMYMHDGNGDGLRVNQGKNVRFYNNTIYKLGHDGMFAIRSENIEAWNNKITCRTNSGLRAWDSNKVKLHDNFIDSFYHWSAGGPGIQIEKSSGNMDSIEIYNNSIHNTYGPGIWIYNHDTSSATQDQARNIHIHHNIFYSTGTNPSINWVGGIVASGFHDTLIESNVFDGAYNAAVIHMFAPYHTPKGGFATIVRNNIIVNTQKRTKDLSGTGYAVINSLPETHNFVLENNCLYNNTGGNYKNADSITSVYANPLFADPKNHDYHLQSTAGRWNVITWVKDKVSSPCIDAGYRYSDYSNEPQPNGNRINIGPDGNTWCASKSELPVPPSILPTAKFRSNTTSGYAPLSIQFTDLSQNSSSRIWSFGDGSNSTQQSPMHKYSKSGNYTVNLTVSNANGTNSAFAKITVLAQSILPVANFSTNVTSGTVPLSVQFRDLSQNSSSRIWRFGDGSNSTQQSPMHTYSVAGNYTVTLTVSNTNGTDSKTRNISVVEKIFTLSGKAYNNRLREASPENVFSSNPFIDVGGLSGVGRYRDVVWFDLNRYTSVTQINKVTFSLFWYYPNSPRLKDTVIEIYRPASTWNSSYVSWNKKNKGIAWKNPGGDWYDKNGVLQGSAPYATFTLRASDLPSNSYCEFNVTDLVREYISGKYSNTGFLLKARDESDNYIAFYSANCGNMSQVPKLKLVYS